MKRNRRVVHLNTVATGGSIPGIIGSLSEGAHEYGFSSKVYFGRGEAPVALENQRVGGLPSQAWDLLWSRLSDRAGKHSHAAAAVVLKQFRDDPPDLVHLHNLHGYWMNHRIILSGLAKLGIPTVWTLHDYWPITGHCAYFEQVGCEKWQSRCRECPQVRRYPKAYRDRSKKNFSEKRSLYDELDNLHVVAVSRHSEKLIGNSILASFPVTTIHNAIDTTIFRPVAPAMKFEGKSVVGCVAKIWDERKGLDDVLKVRELLSESFVMLVVGLSNDQIRRLPPGVVGVSPTLVAEELAALYSSMDVFFNPSSAETFGLTTVEAMACGIPVVLYDVSASREIQPEFMNRGLVGLRSYGRAAEAIEGIVQEARPALGDSLVQYVAEKFSSQAFQRAYYDLYLGLIESGRSGRA